MKKTARIAENSVIDGEILLTGRNVPVSKVFQFGGFVFYIVKETNKYFTCIESTTGARLGVTGKKLSETYTLSVERLNQVRDKLKPAVDRWIEKNGLAENLPCKASYL